MTERKTQGGEILIEEQHSEAEINEINELYSVQQKLDEAGDEAKQQPELYDKVIAAVKKSPKAKKFAAQLIPRYFSLFPDKSEQALNAQLDLCEEEDLQIRANAIKGLPELSKKNQDYSGNIAHVLVQLLAAADEKIELDTIKISLLKILNESNTQEVMSLLFTHVDENPEGLGTKFINLLERVPMHKLQNMEDTLVEKLKSLWAISNLSDFPKFARIIIQLDLFKEAGDATKLEEFINANKNFNINDPIKASETDKIKQLIDIANSLMPLFKTSPCCTPFLTCFVNLNNQSGEIEEEGLQYQILKMIALLSQHVTPEAAADLLPKVYNQLLEYIPTKLMDEDLKLSRIELLFYSFHLMAKLAHVKFGNVLNKTCGIRIAAINPEDHSDKLNDLRTRLTVLRKATQDKEREARQMKASTQEEKKRKDTILILTQNIIKMIRPIVGHQGSEWPKFVNHLHLSFEPPKRHLENNSAGAPAAKRQRQNYVAPPRQKGRRRGRGRGGGGGRGRSRRGRRGRGGRY
eukprot:gb/GECH01010714.1/.p1 GENE.gb/GECH01010714.1/~~gb/GECH01010714.1/.p1  ORF type:complete len:521 (+),score=125.91 gb/GECH01010714.1/:1-1563(+)